MVWFNKRTCAHCNERATEREFEGEPTCAVCMAAILTAREATRTCPVDGSKLLKESRDDFVIDRCPQCNGVWLDAGEVEAIREAARAEGIAVSMVCF